MTYLNWKVIGLAVVVTLGSGCATKKFVNARMDPLGQRVGTLSSTVDEQGKDVTELQQQVSLTDERAITADQKADRAGQAAADANQEAIRAGDTAQQAKTESERARQGIFQLSKRIDGLQDYELAATETILFDFGSSDLKDEAKTQLDVLGPRLEMASPYVVEVQGFTDKTGNADFNLALSQRRAEAVVRYLAAELDVPLRRIHTLGLGSENPAADNKTRDGRKLNRRVEVRLLMADAPPLSAEAR